MSKITGKIKVFVNNYSLLVEKVMHWFILIVCVILAVLFLAMQVQKIIDYNKQKKQEPIIMKQSDIKDTNVLAKNLHLTPMGAAKLQREIITVQSQQPSDTFYVTAPTIDDGAQQIANTLKNNSKTLPAAVTSKTDRTLITANEEKQKVDVYKINLNKAHELKAGVGVYNSEPYVATSYKAGRVEVQYMHSADILKKHQGGQVMYTLKEW